MMTPLLIDYCIISFLLLGFVLAKNNVCESWLDYLGNKDWNEECKYNPDMYMDVPQLLEKYYDKYDIHEIPTTDGYFVTTFRIPRNNSRGVLMLIHPAGTDSSIWVAFGKESIAYYYWKNGYEIWLPNRRGTHFSQKHQNLTVNDFAFWNFGFHETAVHDMRSALKYIYEINNNTSAAVMAHSMSGAEMIIYTSLFPEEAQKLCKIFILLSPTISYKHSLLKFASVLEPFIDLYCQVNRLGQLGGSKTILARILHYVCARLPYICEIVFSSFSFGFSDEGDPLLYPILFTHTPEAMSVITMLHYLQLFGSGKFNMYDYGPKNLEVYGSREPPEYPITKIVAPIFIVHCTKDFIASVQDVENLYQNLPKSARIYGKLKVPGFNHMDAIMGKHRNEQIHDKILTLLNKLFSDYSVFLFRTH